MFAEKHLSPTIVLEEPHETRQREAETTGATSRQRDDQTDSASRRKEKHKYTGQMLNRWPRAFARLLDLAWQMPLIMTGLILLVSGATNGAAVDALLYYLIVFVSLPIALLLDAMIAGIFTNTPAKAIIGVKAVSSRGERLNPGKHLRRNMGVWTDGLALGLLPLSLFTMFKQFKRVSGRRETIYDEKLHVRVRSGRYTGVRTIILMLLTVALLMAAVLQIS